MTEQERQGGWTTIPSSPICIMGAEKWRNYKTEGEKCMKKFLMILLSVAFALNLVLVIGMIGEYISPRQAFYTITDEMMNTTYRFRRGWQLRNRLPWLLKRWTDGVSIFFCILKLYKRNKNFLCSSETTKLSTKNCSGDCAVLQWARRRMNCA